jgi:hypothetical protein
MALGEPQIFFILAKKRVETKGSKLPLNSFTKQLPLPTIHCLNFS